MKTKFAKSRKAVVVISSIIGAFVVLVVSAAGLMQAIASPIKYLPKNVQIKNTLYEAGAFDTYILFRMSDSLAKHLREEGASYLSGDQRSRGGSDRDHHEYVTWRKTPMFDRNHIVNFGTASNVDSDTPRYSSVFANGFFAKRELPSQEIEAVRAEIYSSAFIEGSYFTVDTRGECGILLNPKSGYGLLVCEDH